MSDAGLVLASASPRRHDLLAALGVPFEVVVTDGEDRDDPVPADVVASLPPYALDQAGHPTLLAWRKAHAARSAGWAGPIIGADTIVVLDQQVLGKPRDAQHAQTMLRALAGREHTVYTGVVVLPPEPAPPLMELVQAVVHLAAFDDATIADYVASGEPLDKAGAYGIQGMGGRLVERIAGSFTAVVGLPLPAAATLLQQAGISIPYSVDEAWLRWRQTLLKEPLCIQQSMY